MKNLLFVFVIFGFLFINLEDVFPQKKDKKIETTELDATYHNWNYEETRHGFNTNCVVSWSTTFRNNSNYHVSKIKYKLVIVDKEGTTLYKKTHSIKIDLDPGEVASCDVFKLYSKVCSKYGFDDADNFQEISSRIESVN